MKGLVYTVLVGLVLVACQNQVKECQKKCYDKVAECRSKSSDSERALCEADKTKEAMTCAKACEK